MRLDFNVLWIDDQPEYVQSIEEGIRTKVREEGFMLQTKLVKTVKMAKTFISEDIYGDNIDLVLIDYDLGVNENGEEGLKAIRHKFFYKEVIFYSALSPNKLSKIVADNGLQGVYWTSREYLGEEVFNVFSTLVKKVLDIENSRGIVMGATSDIDYHARECSFVKFRNCDESKKDKILKYIANRLKEIKNANEVKFESLSTIDDITKLGGEHDIYTSNDWLRLLKNILNNDGNKEYAKKVIDYIQNVVPIRNDLAHVKVEKKGFSCKLFKKDGKEITSEAMKKIRLQLIENMEFFKNIAES